MTLQLADMHGDTIATADNDPEATELLATQRFDEFGNPLQSGFLNRRQVPNMAGSAAKDAALSCLPA